MNIGIAVVLIQAFVNQENLLQIPGTTGEQYSEVYAAAQDAGESAEGIIEIMDWLDEMEYSDILFRDNTGKAKK